MGRGLSKAERLRQMEWLYTQRAYSDREMAAEFGVDRATIFRDRRELETEMPIVPDEDGRYRIDRTRYLSNVRVNLHEALALYLAARRASRQTRIAQPHAARGLEKLAAALKQPMTERLAKAAASILEQSADPERVRVVELVAQAWAERRKVGILYRGLHARSDSRWLVSPYLIEPSLWSDGAYLIGPAIGLSAWSSGEEKLMTFKIERIVDAELKLARFEIPPQFDEEELLRFAWGIWYGEGEPTTVRLRFAPGEATRRVKESKWHPTQEIEDLPEGGCIWRAQVAEWQEMLPWVRGWGADCEVLEPEELRSQVVHEANRLARLYSLVGQSSAREWMLWAKADVDSNRIHLLIYHLLDVGQVMLALWRLALPAQTRDALAGALGLDEENASRLLAFWAGLHDLGKAAPGFQRKYPPAIATLQAVGFTFPTPPAQAARHGAISTWALKRLLTEECNLSQEEATRVARMVGGHHGAWPTALELVPAAIKTSDRGDEIWEEARRSLFRLLAKVFQPPQDVHLPANLEMQNALLTLVSGLISVADWIGSMEGFFPFMDAEIPIEQYAARAARQAKRALYALGWVGWQAEGKTIPFSEMFPFNANSIQQMVAVAAEKLSAPALLILEAPTGSGKTEAALYAADIWLQTWRGRGLYIAMPTTATSNQMHQRVINFLLNRYPDKMLNLHLVHGAALLAEPKESITAISQDDEQPNQGRIRAATWFLPRKRTLLAPFGVGTVDQALMSVLQTRHFFVRLFGLSQKVIIFDEVHAYDTYMNILFKQLLRWLSAVGSSVILLSATLPEKTRRELVAAWLGEKTVSLEDHNYPRLTVAAGGEAKVFPLSASSSRLVKIERIGSEPQAIVASLSELLAGGGCAVVICNRVRRAQEVYSAVKEANIVPAEDLILFHARFPYNWRQEIEERVLRLFGKDGQRSRKTILVATQVIEQSLDLDFDCMITDLAPVDLILQRAGRLHRHPQNDAFRPESLSQPRLILAWPPEMDHLPQFGDDEFIYERAILLRSWAALRQHDQIILPQETSALIEEVYGAALQQEIEPELEQAIRQADEEARLTHEQEISQAKSRIIARPDDEDLLSDPNQNLEEEDQKVHISMRALTRMTEPGVDLVCLHQTKHGLALDPDGSGAPLDLDQPPTMDLATQLLRRAVHVQHWGVLKHFLGLPRHEAWKEVSALKYHHPVIFDEQGRCPLEGASLILVLSRETGLEVQKEAK
jgi:CRISPR-associated endonuclease/helicase Cas3